MRAHLTSGDEDDLPGPLTMAARYARYCAEMDDEPEDTFLDDDVSHLIHIHASGRDFGDDDTEDEGYTLITNDMRDTSMNFGDRPATLDKDEQPLFPRAEPIWHVREPTEEILNTLGFLAADRLHWFRRRRQGADARATDSRLSVSNFPQAALGRSYRR
jgi:hypothetical protein